jgi:hypothetical protein
MFEVISIFRSTNITNSGLNGYNLIEIFLKDTDDTEFFQSVEIGVNPCPMPFISYFFINIKKSVTFWPLIRLILKPSKEKTFEKLECQKNGCRKAKI